jgi:hypothetical protein
MSKNTLDTKEGTDNRLKTMEILWENIKEDANKFYAKGNSAAGKRARGYAQEMKKSLQELRIDIQAKKNEKASESTKNMKKI